jgi:L-threonine-O-3-phosphate decarboxylase
MAKVVHGGVTDSEIAAARARGLDPVDLSASLNPYGPHPSVVKAAQEATFARYPEADAHTLRACYAASAGVEPACVLAGNGSTELFYLITRAAAATGSTALILGPTFGEYRAAVEAAGMEHVEWRATPPRFAPLLDEWSECIARSKPRLVFFCNPNNPTGAILARDQVERLHTQVRDHGGTLVVDEAYMDFAWPEEQGMQQPRPGLAVVRSLTKLHAIPGLRLGFLLAEPDFIAEAERHQPSWSVSAPATAAGMQALRQASFALESRQRVAESRDRLKRTLTAAGLAMGPSMANFLLIEAGNGARARAALLERSWVVRDCASFGLPGHIRVSIPRDDLADRLEQDLVECLR